MIFVNPSMTGPTTLLAISAIANPINPAEKLLTNISSPALTLGCAHWSNFLITQAPNGPKIIAAKIIGTSVPLLATASLK